ncbi:MAG: transcriptional regulator, partial [Chloroflexota bacterium]
AATGVTGLTVAEARGSGNGPERATLFGGASSAPALTLRSKLTVLVIEELQEEVIEAILANARTGEPGDGKIFVEP